MLRGLRKSGLYKRPQENVEYATDKKQHQNNVNK